MDDMKQAIRESYGRIANEHGGSGSCCGTSSTCCMAEEYDADATRKFASANLGLGCGTPTEYAGIQEGMTVLDLGSGAGIDVFIASTLVGPSGTALGIDMTGEMIKRANKNAADLGIPNARFILGDIEHMPVPPSSIDRVISNCVLNLVTDKRKAFSEIYRVLKPGGLFAVSDIVTTGHIPEEMRRDRALWAACIAGAIDKEEYLRIAAEAGFRELTILSEKKYENLSTGSYNLLSITVRGSK